MVNFVEDRTAQEVDHPSQLVSSDREGRTADGRTTDVIIATGATGTLNGATVERLLEKLPAEQIGVSVRDPERAAHLERRGVRVRRGTYDDPDALRHSFEGADQVLLVSSSDLTADVLAQHRRAIDAAVDAGARRILYTSAFGAGFDTPYPPLALHAATEQHLAESGVAWTSLRNGFYGDLGQLLGPWRTTRTIARPADGPFAWVDRRDAAEAAAAILVGDGDGDFDGVVDLVPGRPVTLADFAAAASDVTGEPVERVVVDDEEWVAGEVDAGVPEAAARFSLSMFRATREGHFSGSDPTLTRLLGREARTPADMMADHLAA